MDAFLHFFEQVKTPQLFLWVALWMSVFALLENSIPAFPFTYRRVRHARVNFVFLITTALVNFVVGLATAGVYVFVREHQIGLTYWLHWPVWAELILCLLLLDFIGMYGSHYALHRFKWMWRFHMVHHSDTHVDVTTGTRHHPGDWIIREVFALAAVVITGAPVSYYFIFRFLNVVFTYLTHANILLPRWVEQPLSWIFITPNAHKFHHHQDRPWTDMNFGNIFSLWDRLLGTYVYGDVRQVRYGLDVLQGRPDEDILQQLQLPFDRTVKTDD